ncbi:MAG: 2Fe-2S iron-sulfur cluster-binding protein, partial [Gammaproteobacteria bacterium]
MSSENCRLASGGRITRSKPLNFTFDGRRYQGFEGDTLASALIANGVKIVARSFKYHRPRGVYAASVDEPNALVTLRTGARREPNIQATMIELYEGLIAAGQNCWPSLELDLMIVNDWLSPFLAAGF